jgi:hypothetical protein
VTAIVTAKGVDCSQFSTTEVVDVRFRGSPVAREMTQSTGFSRLATSTGASQSLPGSVLPSGREQTSLPHRRLQPPLLELPLDHEVGQD